MNQARVVLPACERNVSDRERICFIRGHRLLFGHVYLVIGRCIEHGGRVAFRQSALDAFGLGDIKGTTIEAADGIAPPFEFSAKLNAQLAAAAKYDYAFIHLWDLYQAWGFISGLDRNLFGRGGSEALGEAGERIEIAQDVVQADANQP